MSSSSSSGGSRTTGSHHSSISDGQDLSVSGSRTRPSTVQAQVGHAYMPPVAAAAGIDRVFFFLSFVYATNLMIS